MDAAAALTPAAAPVIRVRGFTKAYGRRPAVQGVDLTVERGEIFGLIGPDGAGKSSLMKALAGVLVHDAGSVEVLGTLIDSERAAERIKARLGFMPQGLGLHLYPELSVEENIDFFARLRLVPEAALAARKARLLAITRLERFRDRPMKQLSGGMKQKLGLACTLIHEPELVILDEPTTGVDPVSRRDFWRILAELLGRGMSALVSTAYLDEASRFHRLALVHDGRILAAGTPEALQQSVRGCVVRVRAEPQAEALARLRPELPLTEAVGRWVRAFVADGDCATATARVRSALAGLTVAEIEAGEPELEDVFIELVRERMAERPRRDPVPPDAPADASAVRAAGGLAIEADGLTRDFGTFRAVDRASFRVPAGEIFGLLGANGAGKTTVIKMLTGILPPSAGAGHVAGADMRGASRDIKRRIGYVSQAFSLYADLTVIENILLYAGIYGLNAAESRRRAAWVLELGALAGHERDLVAALPMGLRQRLALGCALLHRPQVLFLDEPTSGVDPIGRRRFWDILFALSRRDGVAILVTTHYMSEAEHCDHLALMHAGRIIADAAPQELKRAVEAEAGRVLAFTSDHPAQAMERLAGAGLRDTALFGRRVHLLSRAPEADAARVTRLLGDAGLLRGAIESRAPTLEDVFVYRIGALERQEREART